VRFEFEESTALPRLAWAASMEQGNPVIHVWHGPWVETRPEGFVEGAWDGEFSEFDFDQSDCLAGSGGRLLGEGVVFSTPAHLYERLHAIRKGPRLIVSNSLPFLLALSSDRLDPWHRHYFFDFLDYQRVGISVKHKPLRLADAGFLELHDCCNLEVAADLTITRREKAWASAPSGYGEYVESLKSGVAKIFRNAADSRRKQTYQPKAMISQGYDSVAAAALGSSAGCRDGVTFAKSGSTGGYVDDDGTAIGEVLGMRVTRYERNDSFVRPDYRPEEFYLEPWGVDRTIAVMAPDLAGAILLTGRSGSAVWARHPSNGLPDLRQDVDFLAGCTCGEFRLRTGHIQLHPASLGEIHALTIRPWNSSTEMKPWSLDQKYDKPIARRIAEEAGVPRHLFGHRKKGGQKRKRQPGRVHRLGIRLLLWPPSRQVLVGLFGNRLHPRWWSGSFELQTHAATLVRRYQDAIGAGS
jgi:hypothetical protein